MVHLAKEKVKPRPANRAERPMIWEDSMAEVKETFRRVALVKHTGFSVWDDPRRGPTLEKVLRWNRQARNLSQVPKSLRSKIPPKVLKEIQHNRSVTGFVSQAHLQNVKGMCQRIHAQKSQSERRKNLFDPAIYPVFVRRPPTVACLIDTAELETGPGNLHSHFRSRRRPHSSPVVDYTAPLSYTPQPFKLLYDISNGNYPGLPKRPRSGASGASSAASCYGRLFTRPSSALSKKSTQMDVTERVSSAPGRQQRCDKRSGFPSAPSPASTSSLGSSPKTRRGSNSSRSNYESESRPPSRCANRPGSGGSSWKVGALQAAPGLVVEDLSNRSTYSDCVSLDSMGMPVLFSSVTSPKISPDRPAIPRLRLRGGSGGSSPRKSRLSSSALNLMEEAEHSKKKWQQQQQQEEEAAPEFDVMLSEDDEMVRMEQRPSTVNVPPLSTMMSASEAESFSDYSNWRPQSASNALGRRCSRVTFASPVESNRWEGRARFGVRGGGGSSGADTSEEEVNEEIPDLMEEQHSGEEEVEEKEAAMEDDEVILKHSSDPYMDFKKSMMSMIESEGLQEESRELEQLFQYYLDLNPKMHHPILARVIQDIKAELKNQVQHSDSF